jgi:ribosomal subunit interface protein
MDLRVMVRGVEKPDELRKFAEDKVTKGLARFDKNILGATVRLVDETGAEQKGLDKTCSIEVKLRHGEVRIKEHGDDFIATIHTALDRLKAALSRQVSRAKRGVAKG